MSTRSHVAATEVSHCGDAGNLYDAVGVANLGGEADGLIRPRGAMSYRLAMTADGDEGTRVTLKLPLRFPESSEVDRE